MLFKKGRLPHVVPHLVCLESWKLDYPTFSYIWTLGACGEVLAREHSYSYALGPGMIALYQGRSRSSVEHAVLGGGTWSGEEGKIHPPHQPDQSNHPWRSTG